MNWNIILSGQPGVEFRGIDCEFRA